MARDEQLFGSLMMTLKDQKGFTLWDLEMRTGFHEAQLSRMSRGEQVPQRSDVRDKTLLLDQALGANGKLMKLAGYEPDEDVKVVRRRTFREYVMADKTLTAFQKGKLISYYDGLMESSESVPSRSNV